MFLHFLVNIFVCIVHILDMMYLNAYIFSRHDHSMLLMMLIHHYVPGRSNHHNGRILACQLLGVLTEPLNDMVSCMNGYSV